MSKRLESMIGWIDARFPLTSNWKAHLTEYYAPKNFNFWYYFGSLAMLVLVNQLLTGIFVGGSGQLENTTFALLSPDGKKPLTYAGRSPDWAFANARQMAIRMEQISGEYADRSTKNCELPAVANLRLALNVAACDNLPVVVALADDPGQRKQYETRLATVASHPALLGRAIYCVESQKTATSLVQGRLKPGFAVIQSSKFGLDGRLLAWIDANSPHLQSELAAAIDLYRSQAKDALSHIREGNQQGIYWQTRIPVTDPGPPGGRP